MKNKKQKVNTVEGILGAVGVFITLVNLSLGMNSVKDKYHPLWIFLSIAAWVVFIKVIQWDGRSKKDERNCSQGKRLHCMGRLSESCPCRRENNIC